MESLVLGVVQGITEWLPVSSQGTLAAISAFFFQRTLSEAVLLAFWLHLGTALAALVVFWRVIRNLAVEVIRRPLPFSPLMTFLLLATVMSALVGFPLLLLLEEVSAAVGALAMGVVGAFMLVTGVLQVRQPLAGLRERGDLRPVDGLLAGMAQGFAAIPGLSRSGLTVAALLARGLDRREALALSFLMSIPASAGAGLYAGMRQGLVSSSEALLAAGVAFVVGLVTIRGLLALAGRINFGAFVIGVGALLVVGAIIQAAYL